MPKLSSIRLTDTFVRALRPTDKRFIIYDAALPGFGVRVATSGAISWVLLTRVLGRRKRITLGTYPAYTLSQAREAARQTLASIEKGTFQRTPRNLSFSEALSDWYQREQKANKSFTQVQQTMALHVTPHLGKYQLNQITKADLIRVIDQVADKGKLTQANRVRAFLVRFFTWSQQRDLIETSPATRLPKPAPETTRDRVLNTGELRQVWVASSQLGYPFGAIIKLLILTAQRRDEVAGMRWSELDLAQSRWTIGKDRSKNDKAHIVHLSPPAVAILKQIPKRDDSDFVFTTTGKSQVSGFSKAKRSLDHKSGVQQWRLHDLRRTAATIMAENLMTPPVVVDRILNHVSGAVKGVAAIYQRGEYLEARMSALNDLGAFIHTHCASENIQ